jgi:hypothetical protein
LDPTSDNTGFNPPTIRRQPVAAPSFEPRTSIIRRAPTGPTVIQRAEPVTVPPRPGAVHAATGRTAIAASTVSIISGWATGVVSTDLITGWWGTDRLFCLAVGFLTILFATTTIAGVITLLLRRTVGRYLIAFGALVALLTFGSVFIAGARIPWPVYFIPALPTASLGLVLHSATRRWCRIR